MYSHAGSRNRSLIAAAIDITDAVVTVVYGHCRDAVSISGLIATAINGIDGKDL